MPRSATRGPCAPATAVHAARRARPLAALALGLACALAPVRTHAAQPFIWDQDTNGIDDRIESVHLLGWSASFEFGDTTARQRIQVQRTPALVYSVYVIWAHEPTQADLDALALLGMPVLARIEAVPAARSLATFAQAAAAAALGGVERVEAAPILYPGARDGTAAIGVRDASARVFPSLATGGPGGLGQGVVVAILDTGINDEPEGGFPGHESVRARCLGGAQFLSADSLSHTPRTGSMNPADHGGQVTRAHGTHVASIALGSGAAGGYAAGVAPLARFVDVKVLNDSGFGVAVPEALDWCISNRARDWGSPLPSEMGIDVINLSLSSPDASDGQDLASRLAARAVELGILVVASMGNDGRDGHVPSPAAGDGVIAVGAWDTRRSADPSDDAWAAFNNTGPRASDGDADALDELKPDLLAPGVDVLAANGDVLSDGTRLRRLSGTSMSAAFVSGVCALLREAAPSATPAQIAEWLRASARRPLPGAPSGTGGADPRWRSSRGCGLLDAYAASLERAGQATQLRRLALAGDDESVLATLWTGREGGPAHLVFERAPDAGGAPGAFAPVDSVAAAGSATLDGPLSVNEYARTWPVPAPERGQRFWYRAAYTFAGGRHPGPAVAFTSPGGPREATVEVTLVHDALDSDIDATIRAGQSGAGGPVFELPGTSGAVASDWVDGSSLTGCQAWTFRLAVPAGSAAAFLPPATGTPWTIQVSDGGSLSRSGRLAAFRVTWHSPGGDVAFDAQHLPLQTLEGGTIQASIPTPVVDAARLVGPGAPRVQPNPARAGRLVRLKLSASAGEEARVFDVTGRELARVRLAPTPEGREGEWLARDARGRALPAGIYLVRGRASGVARLVLLDP